MGLACQVPFVPSLLFPREGGDRRESGGEAGEPRREGETADSPFQARRPPCKGGRGERGRGGG